MKVTIETKKYHKMCKDGTLPKTYETKVIMNRDLKSMIMILFIPFIFAFIVYIVEMLWKGVR